MPDYERIYLRFSAAATAADAADADAVVAAVQRCNPARFGVQIAKKKGRKK